MVGISESMCAESPTAARVSCCATRSRYHGHRSFTTFSHAKAVLEKSPALDESFVLKPLLSARFPPYDKTKVRR